MILVLGSSSAAGKNIYKLFDGLKSEEQLYASKFNWVTLYGEKLKELNPSATVLNFAASGHSTSKALSARKGGEFYKHSLAYILKHHSGADALIVNFPAIRSEEGEDVGLVVQNLKEIERRAVDAGIDKVWIATAQPYANKAACLKANSGGCDRSHTIYQSRIDLTAAIIAAFPDSYIDFYSPLAKGRNRLGVADPALLNLKDKLHPNLDGHAALRDAVMAAGVYEEPVVE